MKRFFMSLMASMLLLSSTTYAVEVSKMHNPAKQMMTMSKADTQKMFANSGMDMNDVALLGNGEMAKTEGEAWFFWVFYGAVWMTASMWTYYAMNGW